MRFILRAQSSDANNTIITPIALVSGSAAIEAPLVNIFHNFGASTPVLTGSPSAGNRFAHIQFTGNNAASDTIEVNFSVQFPGNLNLAASQNLAFDLEYTCTAQPGGATGGGVLANQIVFPITVLSGLQASYVGQSLNFGEVGRTADVDAGQIPARSGDIRVASSGPYTIALTSQNRYRMTLSGNNAPADPAQDLDYELSFLGMTRSKVNADTPLSKTCVRAGLGSPPLSGGRLLPIQAKLLEGGAEEVPATTYKDILTVTVTPLAATAPGEVC
jgi:spore coat protein U-like protein